MQNRKMTDSERALAENNINLVPFALNKLGFRRGQDWDDYMQIGYIGLCKAAMSYKPLKGKFSTIAIIKIKSELSHLDAYKKRKKRTAIVISLSTPIRKQGDRVSNKTLQDVIPDPLKLEDTVSHLEIRRMADKLTEKERKTFLLLSDGLNKTQIAKIEGVSCQAIRQRVEGMRKKLTEMGAKYDAG